MSRIDDFVAARNGQSLDYDGAYGAQCVDLAQYWAQYLGTHTFRGNAIDIINQGNDDSYVTVMNGPTNFPEPGDIVVWAANDSQVGTGPYGHVDICVRADANTLTTFDQNWVVVPAHVVTHRNYQGVVGWLHPRVLDPVPSPAAPAPIAVPEPAPVAPVAEVSPAAAASVPDASSPSVPPKTDEAPASVPAPQADSLPSTVTTQSDVSTTPAPRQDILVKKDNNMQTLKAKLSSRKFWVAVLSAVLFALHGDTNQALATILGYIGVQGVVDAQVK